MSLSCIDLYLKNRPKRFESSLTIEAVLLDFQKLIVTALKVKHEKLYRADIIKLLTLKDF